MKNELPAEIYLMLLRAVRNLEADLLKTTPDNEKLKQEIQELYDMINSYEVPADNMETINFSIVYNRGPKLRPEWIRENEERRKKLWGDYYRPIDYPPELL
jgi:hypothetical protein